MGSLQPDFVKTVKEPCQQRHEDHDYDANLFANEIDGIVTNKDNYPCNRHQEDCKWLPLVPDGGLLRQPDGDGEVCSIMSACLASLSPSEYFNANIMYAVSRIPSSLVSMAKFCSAPEVCS